MNIVRWDPFADMNTMLTRLMPRSFGAWPRFGATGREDGELEWSPSADISETDKEYLIRAELPAVRKEDVRVTMEDSMITIQGERKQRKEEKDERFHRVESVTGNFSRSFTLPDNVDEKGIRCDSHDGVLTVHIPKRETGSRKPIEIKVQ